MPHLMDLCDPEALGAAHFLDRDEKPIVRRYTIRGLTTRKPPTGGKEKAFMLFVEKTRTASGEKDLGWYIPTGKLKEIGHKLHSLDTETWTGIVLSLSAGTVRSPKGGECWGIIIVGASRPKQTEVAK